jgi:hypothetical protein
MTAKIDRKILARNWVHSHEEDATGTMVFRPATHHFPPSRGRRSFELRADGTLVNKGIGPDDRSIVGGGSWTLNDRGELVLNADNGKTGSTKLQVLEATPDKLVLKR